MKAFEMNTYKKQDFNKKKKQNVNQNLLISNIYKFDTLQ